MNFSPFQFLCFHNFSLSLRIFFVSFSITAEAPTTSSLSSTCSEFEFTCKSDGICIPLLYRCDLTPDCNDGSDEADCDQSSIVQNQCDNDNTFHHCKYSKKCIPKSWLCDQVFDCGLIGKFNLLDTSDEESSQNCTKTCPVNKLACSNGVCLHISKFCDGRIDCPNDEFSCKDRAPCKNLKCEYDCKITPHGPHCFCPVGQDIVNSTKCVVQKECSEESLDDGEVCDQQCLIVKGENKCSCAPGYEWINNRCLAINCKWYFPAIYNSQMLNFLVFHSSATHRSNASLRSHFEENVQNNSSVRAKCDADRHASANCVHTNVESKCANQHGSEFRQSEHLCAWKFRDFLLRFRRFW